MTEQTISLDIGNDKILNLDTDEKGNFIAFTDSNTVITNFERLALDKAIKFPIIRRLNSELFLLTDSRTDGATNSFIFDFSGNLKSTFLAGDGIEDVIIQDNKIVITYFDEGVLGSDGPNNDGLAVFNFSGQQIFGFNSSKIWGQILDCYCICRHGTNRVLFYAYTDFNLYELNLETLKIEVFDTPNDFEGTNAVSSKADKIYFHSSYHDKQRFFMWDRNGNAVTKFGNRASNLKGIKNGKFFEVIDKGFTIIDPTE
jgi:hypothetical protein